MKKIILLLFTVVSTTLFAQTDTTVVDIGSTELPEEEVEPLKVFYSQRLINANTVEVLRGGMMDFKVTHNFGDVGGRDGGIKNFFGLDNTFDVKIGFVFGLSDRLNLGAARAKGSGKVIQLWELNLKYQMLRQMLNDPRHPLSLTLFANTVVSTRPEDPLPDEDASFREFSDRLSHVLQMMLARRFGNVSFQLNPTYTYRRYVPSYDENGIFALGGAARIPLSKKFVFVFDYFHAFRSDESKAAFRSRGVEFYDAMGAGVEILTEGHIFHLNFTNATSILENYFIPRTTSSWGKGKFRWGFTIYRNFVLSGKKK